MTYRTVRSITLPDVSLWSCVEDAVREVGGTVGKAGASSDDLIEQLADAEHASWARWMAYLFSKSLNCHDGSVVIPGDLVRRWQIQVETPYADLSEREKESDRDEVRHILPFIDAAIRAVSERVAYFCAECATPLQDAVVCPRCDLQVPVP